VTKKTQTKNLIIAVVGMAGAGKSSASACLKKKGFTVLRFGDQTDIGLQEQGLPKTEKNERAYREGLRKELGMAAYAIKMKPRVEKALKTNNQIVLDGLYSWEEYEYLEKNIPDFCLVCIYARPEIRYERLTNREERPLSKETARSRDFAELVNLNKGGPIAMADYLIKNNSSLTDFHEKLDKLLKEIS